MFTSECTANAKSLAARLSAPPDLLAGFEGRKRKGGRKEGRKGGRTVDTFNI